MLKNPLPQNTQQLLSWNWSHFAPLYEELAAKKLTYENVDAWLADWTRVIEAASELQNHLYYALTANTADQDVADRYEDYTVNFLPNLLAAEEQLKKLLLESGLEPDAFAMPLRNMRTESALFREENLAVVSEEQQLATEYDRIIGAQTVQWEGQELTISQLRPLMEDPERARREQAWRSGAERQLADREAINTLWQRLFALRAKMAANAGLPDYRAYRWQELLRFDYTPEDALRFHQAIEDVAVPAAVRIYERRRQRLNLETLRPWDLDVDPLQRPPLRPFADAAELKQKVSAIFHQVHPDLGERFDQMVAEDLLDLENRKNKGPGAYCTSFSFSHRPFIFANAVGLQDDVDTLLHESGHAFHDFASYHLPYAQQRDVPMEFAEVASMGMELLAARFLDDPVGGLYTTADANRARTIHLEGAILFWPYMAVVDAFQHWAYTHPRQAVDPAACDAAWAEQWQRFMAGVDWSGLDEIMVTGWQRKQHILTLPFYYIEYGLAQLGAAQVWVRSLKDPTGAVAAYRGALALGGTVPLLELFRAAGARLAFDAETLAESVGAMENMIHNLDAQNAQHPSGA